MFMYISWKDSLKTHPSNKPYNFIVDLPKTVRFRENWEVALTDIKVKSPKKASFYFLVDFCDESFLQGNRFPLLRRVDEKARYYPFPYFVDINKTEIQAIRVTILDENLNFYPLSDIDCTLKLRKKSCASREDIVV